MIIQVSEVQIQQFLIQAINPKLAKAKVLEIERDAEHGTFNIHLQVEEPEQKHYLPPQAVDPITGAVKLIYDHVWAQCPECRYNVIVDKRLSHKGETMCYCCGLLINYIKDEEKILSFERVK